MRVTRGSHELEKPPARCVLTIGNFDGVHIGHRAILRTVVERAHALDGAAIVYTFDPHPRKVLQPQTAPRLLATLDQKLEWLAEAGIDHVVIEPFTREFAGTDPERFVRDYLHARFRPLEVYVGYDFHFGKDREGSMRLLSEMGPRLGFAVTIVPEVTIGDEDVNSTRIRALLAEGDVELAARLLGRLYTVRGRVVEGDRRGHALGFPTANLETENEVLPASGVYAARVRRVDAEEGEGVSPARPAVANLGHRPTFGGDLRFVIEAHLIDFEGDLYGERLDLGFVKRLREEQRFEGPEALREQIARDVDAARAVLEGR